MSIDGAQAAVEAQGSEFTVVELKEILRARELPTAGSKVELIRRLSEHDPQIWTTLRERRTRAKQLTGLSKSDNTLLRHISAETDEGEENDHDAPNAPRERAEPGEREVATPIELELLRRERDLLERERAILRRELELARSSPLSASSPTNSNAAHAVGGVRNIKEMLPEFDATDNTFWRWKQQLELLRQSYQLDDNSTRILMSSRLKGRALSWLHSKAEHVTLNVENLLKEMEKMFDLRPGKLVLRRKFEARIWKSGEQFCEYYHDKIILAN